MAHGGKRKGAGRKVGSVTKRTREIAERAAAEGLTPLDVMLDAMRHLHGHARKLMADQFPQDAEAIAKALGAAAAIAKDAAPYVHPRLAAVEHTGKDGGAIEVVTKIQRDAAVSAALRADR